MEEGGGTTDRPIRTDLHAGESETASPERGASAAQGRGVQGGNVLEELQMRAKVQRTALRPAAGQRRARGGLPSHIL